MLLLNIKLVTIFLVLTFFVANFDERSTVDVKPLLFTWWKFFEPTEDHYHEATTIVQEEQPSPNLYLQNKRFDWTHGRLASPTHLFLLE